MVGCVAHGASAALVLLLAAPGVVEAGPLGKVGLGAYDECVQGKTDYVACRGEAAAGLAAFAGLAAYDGCVEEKPDYVTCGGQLPLPLAPWHGADLARDAVLGEGKGTVTVDSTEAYELESTCSEAASFVVHYVPGEGGPSLTAVSYQGPAACGPQSWSSPPCQDWSASAALATCSWETRTEDESGGRIDEGWWTLDGSGALRLQHHVVEIDAEGMWKDVHDLDAAVELGLLRLAAV